MKSFQDETINSLEEMKEFHFKEIEKHQDEIDIINGVIAKFQTQLLMSETKWKLDEKN